MTREAEGCPGPNPDLIAEVRRRACHPADRWEPVASARDLTRDARDALRAQGDGASPERAGPDPGTRPPRRARG